MNYFEPQPSSNPSPRCQKRNCSHRGCPQHISNRTCPSVLWCPQCTRFWCEDCWEDVDAHQPIVAEVLEMRDHERTIPEFVNEEKSVLHSEGSDSERMSVERLLIAPQEQDHSRQVSNSSLPPNNAQQHQYFQSQPKQIERSNKPYLLAVRQRQASVRPEPIVDATFPNPADIMEQGTFKRPYQAARSGAPTPLSATSSGSADKTEQDPLKRRRTESPASPTSGSDRYRMAVENFETLLEHQGILADRQEQENVGRVSSAKPPRPYSQRQGFGLQLRLLEQQNKKRLVMAREARDKRA